jgi:hypothetical protein
LPVNAQLLIQDHATPHTMNIIAIFLPVNAQLLMQDRATPHTMNIIMDFLKDTFAPSVIFGEYPYCHVHVRSGSQFQLH